MPRSPTKRSKENLQTVIVSKSIAKTRQKALKIAEKYAKKIYTSRETSTSWRFRQKPPEDFKPGTFKTFKVPGQDVSLVYGDLKNPSDLNYKKELKLYREYFDEPKSARNIEELSYIANDIHNKINSNSLLDQLDFEIAKKARSLGYKGRGDIYEISRQIREYGQQDLFENPTKMPDPGPCAWLGDLLEFKWEDSDISISPKSREQIWENGKQKWMFLWSPKLKAIIGIPKPKMKNESKVSRKGGAAKIAERFNARDAKSTHEIEIPNVELKRLGKAIHIVYRSDKWNPNTKIDYIHDFKNGVSLYVGPNEKRPKIFLCKGGKLTVTERGLVF